jgi:hypothetical protein
MLPNRLDRLESVPFRLGNQEHAGVYRLSIQKDGTGPALSRITPVLRTQKAQATERFEQRLSRERVEFVIDSVDSKASFHGGPC